MKERRDKERKRDKERRERKREREKHRNGEREIKGESAEERGGGTSSIKGLNRKSNNVVVRFECAQ